VRPADAVAAGLLQGPAELLPVSSSAHVGLLLRRRGVEGAERKEAEVALHAGTAVALALLDRRQPRWGLLIAATAPPALAGLVLERRIETRLGSPRSIAAGLVAGSVAMALSERTPVRRTMAGVVAGLWLGVAQAVALVPGVSRSGATRAAARARGFGREDAAALSREVALPVLLGAATLKGARLAARRPPRRTVAALAAGAVAAAASTAAALRLERTTAPLTAFAAYRTGLAILLVWHDRGR
jgi:undecaprenyl-diphosphatase